MAELDHVDDAYGSGLVEPVAGAAVAQIGLAVSGDARLVSIVADLLEAGTVEDRGAELEAELVARPSEDCLIYLTEVHS